MCKKYVASVFIYALLTILCGCSSSYQVSSTGMPDAAYSYPDMNEELKGRDVKIEMKDGRDISAKEVKINENSISWIDEQTDKESKTGIQEINKIVMKSSSIGALECMGFGLVGGGGLGFLVGTNMESREIPMDFVGLILGGGTGTIVGLITGLIVGHRYNYEFPTSEQNDFIQNRK